MKISLLILPLLALLVAACGEGTTDGLTEEETYVCTGSGAHPSASPQDATYTLPDDDPETVARLVVVTTETCSNGKTRITVLGNFDVVDNVATVQCWSGYETCGTTAETITFYMR